jgi:hypothetical protein
VRHSPEKREYRTLSEPAVATASCESEKHPEASQSHWTAAPHRSAPRDLRGTYESLHGGGAFTPCSYLRGVPHTAKKLSLRRCASARWCISPVVHQPGGAAPRG